MCLYIFLILAIIIFLLYIFNDLFFKKYESFNSLSKKQIKFNQVLTDMKKILDNENQEFFLSDGTLLGCYREKKFIEHDGDIDIGIFSEKYNANIEEKNS